MQPTGHAPLDTILPGGGWPLGALTEILADHPGLGELGLVLPGLAAISRRGGTVVLVDPPWIPCPQAIHGRGIDLGRLLLVRTADTRESLWACEQALRTGHGGALLAWPRGRGCGFTQLRRLQLAARASGQVAFLFRPAGTARTASPAALRLRLEAHGEHLLLTLVKVRGVRPGTVVRLHRPHGRPFGETPAADTARRPVAAPLPTGVPAALNSDQEPLAWKQA